MKRDLGNSSRVKNIFACANGNFFALGKTSKGWFSILNSDCQSASRKFRPLPQREALIGSFTATGNLITQAFLFTLAAYLFIG